MTQARLFGSIWQGLRAAFAWAFTPPGHRRVVAWVTALALWVEEHPITGSVTALDRPADGKAREHGAATGAWPTDLITRIRTRLLEDAPGRSGHGYHLSAVEDTTVHRPSARVWGTGTFPESTARCPPRASTVRAHPGVILGAILRDDDRPAWFLPRSGRLAFRQSQRPSCSEIPGATTPFRTPGEPAAEWLRQQARIAGGRHLADFEGGSARARVIRPLVRPEDGSPRLEVLTRWRHDARLHAPRPNGIAPSQKGGRTLPPPRQGGWWTRPGPAGKAFLSGRPRQVRWKEVVCRFWGGSAAMRSRSRRWWRRWRDTRSDSRWPPQRGS